ncbi:cache domain-containing protein, partial [Vibrio sp. 10N.261.45.A7]
MKFSHKIVATSTVLLMLTVGFLGARQTMSMQSNMELTVNEAVVDAVNGVRNTVEQELAGKSLLAEFITARAETDLRREHLESLVRESSLSDAFIFVGGALNEDGLAFSSDSSWAPSVKEWDGRTRPWYKQARQENELIITEPYTDSLTGDIVISIATPLHANSNFNGAMFFDVGLKGLSDLVNSVELFNAGKLFIVTGSGKVIAHPEKEFNGKPISDILPAISIKDKTTHQITGVDGIDYQVQFRKVAGQDWFVVSMLDKKVAFASVQSMINSTIVSGLVLLLISVLVLFFAISKLIRPLSCLNEAIGDIASG